MHHANNKSVDYLFRALYQSEFDRVQTEDFACRIWSSWRRLTLETLRFRLGCTRLIRESTRISLISPVSQLTPCSSGSLRLWTTWGPMCPCTRRSDSLQSGEENLSLNSRKWEPVRMNELSWNPRAIYMKSLWVGQMTKLPLEHKWRHTHPHEKDGQVAVFLHQAAASLSQSASYRHKPCNPAECPPALMIHGARGSLLRPPVSGLDFVAQPRNPRVLWWTSANPTCKLRCEPLPCTSSGRQLRLAFPATMQPAFDPVRSGLSSRSYLSLHSTEALQG
jgi:hypothetical protein